MRSLTGLFERTRGRLVGDRFLCSVATLAGGTAFAQVLSAIAGPVLTRIYTPADYGVVAVYSSLLGICAVFYCMRYEMAIPLPNEDRAAANVLALCFVCGLGSTAVLLGFVYYYGEWIVVWLKAPALRPYLWLLPAGFLLSGTYSALNYWAVRRRAFGRITRTRINQSLSSTLVNLVLGALGLRPAGMLIGSVVSQSAGIGLLASSAWKDDRTALCGVSGAGIKMVAIRYRNFPLFTAWGGLLNTIGTMAPPLLLTRYFSADVTGNFGLALRVLSLPLSLVGSAIGQVYFAEIARADTERARRMTKVLAGALLSLGIPFFTWIMCVGPGLFRALFGDKWLCAGQFSQWLAPWWLVTMVSSPLSTIAVAKERQRFAFGLTLYEVVIRLGALFIGGMLRSVRMAVLGYGISGVLITGVALVWFLRLAQVPLRDLFNECRPAVLVGILTWVTHYSVGLYLGPSAAFAASSVVPAVGCLAILKAQVPNLRGI